MLLTLIEFVGLQGTQSAPQFFGDELKRLSNRSRRFRDEITAKKGYLSRPNTTPERHAEYEREIAQLENKKEKLDHKIADLTEKYNTAKREHDDDQKEVERLTGAARIEKLDQLARRKVKRVAAELGMVALGLVAAFVLAFTLAPLPDWFGGGNDYWLVRTPVKIVERYGETYHDHLDEAQWELLHIQNINPFSK